MTVDKDIIVYIHLSKEENSILQSALTLLRDITKEFDNPDVKEVKFNYECDMELINEIINKAEEIRCEFFG